MKYLILSLILLSGCTEHIIKHEVSAPQLDNLTKKIDTVLTCPEIDCPETVCSENTCPKVTCPKFYMPPLPEKANIIIVINGKSLKGTNKEGREFLKNYVQARKLLK